MNTVNEKTKTPVSNQLFCLSGNEITSHIACDPNILLRKKKRGNI